MVSAPELSVRSPQFFAEPLKTQIEKEPEDEANDDEEEEEDDDDDGGVILCACAACMHALPRHLLLCTELLLRLWQRGSPMPEGCQTCLCGNLWRRCVPTPTGLALGVCSSCSTLPTHSVCMSRLSARSAAGRVCLGHHTLLHHECAHTNNVHQGRSEGQLDDRTDAQTAVGHKDQGYNALLEVAHALPDKRLNDPIVPDPVVSTFMHTGNATLARRLLALHCRHVRIIWKARHVRVACLAHAWAGRCSRPPPCSTRLCDWRVYAARPTTTHTRSLATHHHKNERALGRTDMRPGRSFLFLTCAHRIAAVCEEECDGHECAGERFRISVQCSPKMFSKNDFLFTW